MLRGSGLGNPARSSQHPAAAGLFYDGLSLRVSHAALSSDSEVETFVGVGNLIHAEGQSPCNPCISDVDNQGNQMHNHKQFLCRPLSPGN